MPPARQVPRGQPAAEPPVSRELESLPFFAGLSSADSAPASGTLVELMLFSGIEFGRVDASNTRFLECAFTDTTLEGGSLRRAHLSDVWMRRVRLVDVDLAETSWHDVTILDSSIAAVEAYSSQLRRVVFAGCKFNSLNLREAKLTNVDFVDCTLQDVDLMSATLKNTRFIRTTITGLDLRLSTLDHVDFSTAEDVEITSDGNSLRGAIISSQQLMTMAPAFAQSLGITVRD